MQPATRIDRKFITWHIIYTLLLAAWSAHLWNNRRELGPEPPYWMFALGVVPSLLLLMIGLLRPMAAYKAAMAYGLLVVLVGIILSATAYGFLWMVVFLPSFGFVIEALIISRRWPSLRRQNENRM